jgi:hypothetical protein
MGRPRAKPLIVALAALALLGAPARGLAAGPAAQSTLAAVACTGPNACIAVGQAAVGANIRPLAEVLMGGRFHAVATPEQPWRYSELAGVSCAARRFCMAVGGGGKGALAELWNGRRLSIVPAPEPYGANSFAAVSCISRTMCIAVGSTALEIPLAEQWNGTRWSATILPLPAAIKSAQLTAVSCSSATRCVAVGNAFTAAAAQTPLVESFNAGTWSRLAVHVHGSTPSLAAVSCPTSSWCLAVGTLGGADPSPLVFALEDRRAVQLGGPPTSEPILSAVSCLAQSDCVAVGSEGAAPDERPLVAALSPSGTWTVQATADAGTAAALRGGIACTSHTNCVAVGYDVTAAEQTSEVTAAFAERLRGSQWSPLGVAAGN